MEDAKNGIWPLILALYLLIGEFMALYFWYLWAKTHGFLNTIFIGFWVAHIKGLLWILFI